MPNTRKTLFIADLHLDKSHPQMTEAFLTFIDSLKTQPIDALYILGDLFEYWLGDDCVDTTAKQVANALTDYHNKTQTPIYYIHGNRDFLLRQQYANSCSMNILTEHHVVNLYGNNTLLLHGDTLCTDDFAYMQFRQNIRTTEWQAKILRWPKWARRLKALQMRWRSQRANAGKSLAIMDVSQQTIAEFVKIHQVTRIIHGHTHRPAIHQSDINNAIIERCVVGDWYEQGSVLAVTPEGAELIVLDYPKNDINK